MYTLKDVPVGQSISVVKLYASGAIKRRIMDMGITRRCKIYVRKVAPFGDPIELNLRGYELTLRKADAALIEVEDIQAGNIIDLESHQDLVDTREVHSCR